MNKVQIPSWVSGRQCRGAIQREVQDELFEALYGDTRALHHGEMMRDE